MVCQIAALLISSNYWESDLARAGYLYLSINAGAFRLLVPESQRSIISDIGQRAFPAVTAQKTASFSLGFRSQSQ
jgi:hypothetical protein